jgi:hypothetical protein
MKSLSFKDKLKAGAEAAAGGRVKAAGAQTSGTGGKPGAGHGKGATNGKPNSKAPDEPTLRKRLLVMIEKVPLTHHNVSTQLCISPPDFALWINERKAAGLSPWRRAYITDLARAWLTSRGNAATRA